MRIAATLALLAVIACSALRAVTHWPWTGPAAAGALVLYLILEGRNVTGAARRVLAMAVLAALAALFFHPDGAALVLKAGIEAANIAALLTALGFLREAAETSPLVQSCGEIMLRQPPGRRYAVLCLGSHVISLVLNFGTLSLLGTMAVKGNTIEAAGGDSRIQDIRTQRMMNAVLRGFAAMTVWSPLSVSFAVTQNAIHGISWMLLLPLQMVLALALMALGWAMDRHAFPVMANRPGMGGPSPLGPPLRLLALVAVVVMASVAVAEALSVTLVVGAMLVVPPAALIWLIAQHRALLPATLFFGQRLIRSMPAFRNEIAMVGGAMFLGVVVVAFVSPADTANAIAALHLPAAVLVVLLSWSVMVLAQFGLSQIVTVTLLGGALGEAGALGLPPLALASGLMGAWALSACSTPVGAATLTVARIAQVPVTTVARRWNGRYVLAGALALGLWLIAMVEILDSAPSFTYS